MKTFIQVSKLVDQFKQNPKDFPSVKSQYADLSYSGKQLFLHLILN